VTHAAPDWDVLRGDISGDVILPGSPEYELVRKAAIAGFYDVRPHIDARDRGRYGHSVPPRWNRAGRRLAGPPQRRELASGEHRPLTRQEG
jgi:hypothetical protein